MVPLADMFGYVEHVALALAGARAVHMQFDHYEPVPQMVADEIRAKYA